jgi:hypothetical protein
LNERKAGHPDAVDGFNVDALIGAIGESSQKKSIVTIDWKGL